MLTQIQVGQHLDLSQPAVSGLLDKLKIGLDAGLDAIRIAYIRHLRASAAGWGAPADKDRYWIAKANGAELDFHERVRNVVPLSEVRQANTLVAARVRSAFQALPDRIAPLVGPETDPARVHAILAGEVHGCLDELAYGLRTLAADGMADASDAGDSGDAGGMGAGSSA